MKAIILVLIGFPIFGKIPSYKDAKGELKKIWLENYPIAFIKIQPYRKSRFLRYQKKGKMLYIYPFKVLIPIYKTQTPDKNSIKKQREVFVKLIYNPKNQTYKLSLENFDEKFQRGNIRWIR